MGIISNTTPSVPLSSYTKKLKEYSRKENALCTKEKFVGLKSDYVPSTRRLLSSCVSERVGESGRVVSWNHTKANQGEARPGG
jgi:hypothetical protein